jgi:heme-degrading monooxygenase HmoA
MKSKAELFLFSIAVLIVLSLSCVTTIAQSGRGSMHGYVSFEGISYDEVSKMKVHASVELRSMTIGDSRTFKGETTNYGSFDLKEVPMGEYHLRISAPGFIAYETEIYLPSDFNYSVATRLKANAGESKALSPQKRTIVARIWHGRTLTTKADEYYDYLKEAGIKKIEAIEGNLGAQVLRRAQGENTEFVVITYWESRDAIKKFAGNDIEKANSLPRDREFLLEIEPTVRHFDVLLDDRK